MTVQTPSDTQLIREIRACTLCKDLPLGPKPILQFSPCARILIVGQAPGRMTHGKDIPFDDPSGVRLRAWMGLETAAFYDPDKVAILPMGFCFPGTGQGGDMPPREICARTWRRRILDQLGSVEFTVIIGRYALDWHLPAYKDRTLTQVVQHWRDHWPDKIVLPHPSPRNNRWIKSNPWFETEVVPELRTRIASLHST